MSLHVEGGSQVQVPRSLMQAFLQQDPNHPGLETVRLPTGSPGADDGAVPANCRELESEVCLVCRRCGRAYPQESSLLAHQRSCYLGNQQRRGALRLVQTRYVCALCDAARSYASVGEWRRHAESLQHRARLEASQDRHQQHQQQFVQPSAESGQCAGEEANPLIDEMEDVVNQITLLAAKAAAESTTGQSQNPERTSQDNNNGPELKRQKLVQEVAALAGAR